MNDPLEGLPSKQLSPKFWKKKLNDFHFLILNSTWNCFLLAIKLPTFKIFQPWVRKILLTKMGSMTKPQWLSASPSLFQKPMWILLFTIRRNIYTVYLYVFIIYEGYMRKYKIWYVTFFQKINKNMQRKLGMKYFEHLRVWRHSRRIQNIATSWLRENWSKHHKTLSRLFSHKIIKIIPSKQGWVFILLPSSGLRWYVINTGYHDLAKINSRSSRSQVFFKTGVLKKLTKFTGKHLCQRRLWHRFFPMNLAKFLRTSL